MGIGVVLFQVEGQVVVDRVGQILWYSSTAEPFMKPKSTMLTRLRQAIQDAEAEGPAHSVALSKTDAKRLLYRLIKEAEANGLR